ncbi:hypothetical protein T05_2052 [Trichinella murrelli]|uniref:Uncharacterized protein n=1 Tax=Trichinella murrelli TaxID=144512 RepID=A0A0V0TRF6_9BILA|nr:hypothetical protein T05_2052 [Trichinella murrelli]
MTIFNAYLTSLIQFSAEKYFSAEQLYYHDARLYTANILQTYAIGRFKYRSFKNGIINANASKILNCTEVRKLLGGVDPISPLTPPTFSQNVRE